MLGDGIHDGRRDDADKRSALRRGRVVNVRECEWADSVGDAEDASEGRGPMAGGEAR